MRRIILFAVLVLAVFAHSAAVVTAGTQHPPVMSHDPAGKVVLVRDGISLAPIVTPENPAPFIQEAAKDLAMYIEKISGAKAEILAGAPTPLPQSAIYVGYQPVLKDIFPAIDFDFAHPEEILLAADEKNVIICGRDRAFPTQADFENDRRMTASANGFAPDFSRGLIWTEAGTSCAVYTFLEACLDVRWLWEGPLGEDVIESRTIALTPFEYRHHPVFRRRHLWPRFMKEWYCRQRIWYYSEHWAPGHSFTDWWDKYHEAHPGYFALNGDKRLPPLWGPNSHPPGVKLCVSNPDVAAQWLANIAEELNRAPWTQIGRAGPNDGPGFCTCESCRAMDHPDASGRGRYSDRYVKFWNGLARGLKARFPDRKLSVGAMAYSFYNDPPIGVTLEDNVVIGFVGNFPNIGRADAQRQQERWKAWAKMAREMSYRPNLFKRPSRGGLELDRTTETMRFLADNHCVGLNVDTLPNNWAIQGPQYYLMAQLAYAPYKDGAAVLKDYFARGFGPAAEDIEGYFRVLEAAHYKALDALADYMANNEWDVPREDAARKQEELCEQTWNDMALIAEAGRRMKQAEEKVADAPEIYRKRLEYIKAGFDYLRLSAEIANLQERLRDGGFKDMEIARQALALCTEREKLYKSTWQSKGHYLRYALSGKVDVAVPEIIRAPELGRMRYLADQKMYKLLIAEFGEVEIAAWPKDTRFIALLLRAEAHRNAGDKRKAVADYARCVEEMNPSEDEWAKALDALVQCHADLGAYDHVSEIIRRELPRFEQSPQAKNTVYPIFLERTGRVLMKQKKYDEALDLLAPRVDKVVRGQTWQFNLLEMLGELYARKGNPDAARARYRQALRMYENRTGAFYEQRIKRVTEKLQALDK